VCRVDVNASLMKNGGKARATAWNLSADLLAGGLKKLRPSHDRRFVVVRTSEAIQELDTQACTPTTVGVEIQCDAALRRWTVDGDTESANGLVSDIAVDDNRRIFSTGIGVLPQTDGGYVQMLVPTKLAFTSSTSPLKAPAGTAFRWHDIGVNQCGANDNIAGPCNSGIDVRPSNSNLVYVSNQGANSIDELNLTTNTIRRWVMPPPIGPNDKPVNEPRQLKIDSGEKIWVTTGSGHLVSLKVNGGDGCPNGTNRMTRHAMPGLGDVAQTTAAGWGVAPDSNVIGYTDSNDNKVGMLLPKDGGFCQKPVPVPADKIELAATATTVGTTAITEPAPATVKTVLKQTVRKQDGTYVEAVINTPAPGTVDPKMTPPDSLTPLGITPVKGKAQGTFFYTVGFAGEQAAVNRFGFVRLGVPERINNPRDDDDSNDGFTTTDPTWNVGSAGDADGDGVPDEYDTNTSRDNMTMAAPTVVPVGQSWDYPMSTTPTSLALIAAATPDSPTATIAVDVYNSIGTLVGTSGPIVGAATATVPTPAAGNYTVRIRNLGTSNVTPTPTVVVREPLIQQ
jgi:hypothetical protein